MLREEKPWECNTKRTTNVFNHQKMEHMYNSGEIEVPCCMTAYIFCDVASVE